MATIQEQLVEYGRKVVAAGLTAGTGGNISARDVQQTVWMKPSGFSLEELAPQDLCGVHLKTGKQTLGRHKVTAEVNMHVAVYRARADVNAVFHLHPPWLNGVISAGVPFRPLTSEVIFYLGRYTMIPYVAPTTLALADCVAEVVTEHDTIFMPHHGVLAVGTDIRQAWHRCMVAEDEAKAQVAAAMIGKPQYLTAEQIEELRRLG